jgi:ribosomal protein L11 methyltransferase
VRRSATCVARLTADQTTARRLADILAEMLDPDDAAVAVFASADRSWTVEIIFRHPPDQTALRTLLAAADPDAARSLAFATVADKDWVAASLAGLKPVAAGRFVVYGSHDRARVPANAAGIEIEAALAFGTGHHGTTRGCLLALDRIVKSRRPSRILDVGCGSGVLAIAAAKALRRPVLASDIDRPATIVAQRNARANRVGTLVEVVHAPGVRARRIIRRAPFHLILANILLGSLTGLAAPLARLTAPGARVVLSGLLPAHAHAALAAYRAQRLFLERRIDLDGWVTLVLVRRGSRRAAHSPSDPRLGP